MVSVGRAAEKAGADWFTVRDRATWRDAWMMAGMVAEATEPIRVGPGVTNPFLRHAFHTVAALATLHDISGGRAMLGVGAGASLLADAVGLDRRNAPSRVAELIELVRNAGASAPLDEATGHVLDFELPATPILATGRKDGMLRSGGRGRHHPAGSRSGGGRHCRQADRCDQCGYPELHERGATGRRRVGPRRGGQPLMASVSEQLPPNASAATSAVSDEQAGRDGVGHGTPIVR